MKDLRKLSFLFCILAIAFAGCDDDFSGVATPNLTIQVSASTCQSKIESFNVRVEGSGVSGQVAPGEQVTLGLTIGNHRLIADSVPPGITHDQVYFIPAEGRTVVLECP